MDAPLWESIAWLLGLLAVVALGDYGAVLLVRAEERQREQDAEAKRAAARSTRRPTLAGPCSDTDRGAWHNDAAAGARCPTYGQDRVVCDICAPPVLAMAQSRDGRVP